MGGTIRAMAALHGPCKGCVQPAGRGGGRRGTGPGVDRLGVLAAGLAQVGVHVDEAGQRGVIEQVGLKAGGRLGAERVQLADKRFGRFGGQAIVHDDVGAGRVQFARDRTPNPLCCAGDQYRFANQARLHKVNVTKGMDFNGNFHQSMHERLSPDGGRR